MSTRKTLPAIITLMAAFAGLVPSAWATTELDNVEPDQLEIERVAELLGLPEQKVALIYPALVWHRNTIKEEVSARDRQARLSWKEFLRIRKHASTAAKTIRPHLGTRTTHQLMRNVHSFLVPQSIRPRRHWAACSNDHL